MKKTVKITTCLLLSTVILTLCSFKSFQPKIVALEKETHSVPSILPIKKDEIIKISSHFGKRYNPLVKREKLHTGVDIIADEATEILATADGIVELSNYSGNYGNHIKIKHDDTYQTLYSHLKNSVVKEGQSVKKGDVIGIIGNTGKSVARHLHYEVIKNNIKVNPINYFDWKVEEKK